MAQPFVSNGMSVRLTPLMQAVAASQAPTGSGRGGPVAGAASAGVASAMGLTNQEPNLDPTNPAHVQAAIEAAKQGDQSSIDWLRTLGLGSGVLAGAVGAGKLYSDYVGKSIFVDQRGKPSKQPMQKMGADKIAADAKVPAVIPKREPQMGNLPDVVYAGNQAVPQAALPAPSLENRPPNWRADSFAKRNTSTRDAVKALGIAIRGIK